jgi:hypothetical protein
MANFRWNVQQVVQDSLIAVNFNDNREDILDDGGKLSELRVVELDLGIECPLQLIQKIVSPSHLLEN